MLGTTRINTIEVCVATLVEFGVETEAGRWYMLPPLLTENAPRKPIPSCVTSRPNSVTRSCCEIAVRDTEATAENAFAGIISVSPEASLTDPPDGPICTDAGVTTLGAEPPPPPHVEMRRVVGIVLSKTSGIRNQRFIGRLRAVKKYDDYGQHQPQSLPGI